LLSETWIFWVICPICPKIFVASLLQLRHIEELVTVRSVCVINL
jgi:hypothetical protein